MGVALIVMGAITVLENTLGQKKCKILPHSVVVVVDSSLLWWTEGEKRVKKAFPRLSVQK